MFDIGASELLLIVIVAIVVIGPKDMPMAIRAIGRWVGKARRISGHFRSGIETMIREAEMEEMEREWKERNAQIMAQHPDAAMEEEQAAQPPAGAESRTAPQSPDPAASPKEGA